MALRESDRWLRDALVDLREENKSIREEMRDGFAAIRQDFRRYEESQERLGNRMTAVETRQSEKDNQSTKRGTWAGILAAAGLTGLIEFFKKVGH